MTPEWPHVPEHTTLDLGPCRACGQPVAGSGVFVSVRRELGPGVVLYGPDMHPYHHQCVPRSTITLPHSAAP